MQTLSKAERLCSTKTIQQLFEQGKSFACYPIRLVFMEVAPDTPYPVRMAVSVSKKYVKKATERNKIKRRIKEAYRKNKHQLYDRILKTNKQYAMMFLYTSNENTSYQEIENKIILSLQRLKELL